MMNQNQLTGLNSGGRWPRPPRSLPVSLGFAMIFPSLITGIYFIWLSGSGSSWQQLAFGLGKFFQFAFPITYLWYFRGELRNGVNLSAENQRLVTTRPPNGLAYALVFSTLVAAAMIVIYATLIPADVAARLQDGVTEKIASLGIDTVWQYAALGLFYTICHSFLEEYYWRWFVFDSLRTYFSNPIANVISSVGFMAHHVILLGFYFGWASPLTWLFSVCVAIGGSFWAWLYQRNQTIKLPWFSHAIVDAAIFSLGLFMVRDVLQV